MSSPLYSTDLRAGLLEACASRAGDPGLSSVQWLRTGAPAGIDVQPEVSPIFPLETLAEAEVLPTGRLDTVTGEDGSTNVHFDNDEEAVLEVRRYADKGWLKVAADLDEFPRSSGGSY